MLVYGVNTIAKELGCSQHSLRRIIQKHPEFPAKMLSDIGTYAFELEGCKEWWAKHRSQTEIPTDAIQQNEFAQKLGVSKRMVLVWRQNGLEVEKLSDGTVWINIDVAKRWFQNRSDKRTRIYADKL